jgi:predicted alpha-1,2-mannosidase
MRPKTAIPALVLALSGPSCRRPPVGSIATPVAPAASRDLLDAAGGATRYVNPFIGTATVDGAPDTQFNAGDTFPGAVVPFGMVQWSPDNTTAAGGYRYDIPRIDAFSLTHFSGRGLPCWQDIGIVPTVGDLTRSPDGDWSRFGSPFRHERERASPGRYGVRLDGPSIDVELTVTARTGMARFSFPRGAAPTVLLNAGHSAQGNSGPGTGVRVLGPTRVVGSAESGNCGGAFRYRVFFAAEFDRAFVRFGTWNGATLTPGATSATGADTGAFLTFAAAEAPLQMRVGLSFVSPEGAARNLLAENAGWDFEAVARAAARSWEARLASIEVRGGTPSEKDVFYTALYHTFLHPNVFSDADGSTLGFDGQIHVAPPGHARYENFAGWDNYRSEIPLLSLIAPVETGDMMAALVEMAAQDPGGGLPRWQQAAGNSGGMVGDSQDVALASAHAFGVTGFDARAALRAMDRGASDPGARSGGHLVREGLAAYLDKGYVPYATSRTGAQSAAITLEYATDDFAIAALAGALGDEPLRDRYLQRSKNWRKLWLDRDGGLLAPRRDDGSFLPGTTRTSQAGFVEGSAEQYVWMVPFDLHGLAAAMGGNQPTVTRLDEFFRVLNDGMDSAHSFFGNEPGENTPWIYAFVGAPARTQAVVRRILRELYLDEPRGLPGNDDAGALSSWAVFASLGLYPSIPGVAGFVVGSPLFPEITVRLARNRVLRIVAPEARAAAPFVRSLRLDGHPYDRAWIPWSAVAGGAELAFGLSDRPDPSWAVTPDAAPP